MNEKDEDQNLAVFAKVMTLMCVRNTFLEDLHAGKVPVSKTGDYSDVKVIDGEGREIPWNDLSRLDDDEMKKLMKQIVNRIYTYFKFADEPNFQDWMNMWSTSANRWDDPELDEDFKVARKHSPFDVDEAWL